MITLAWTLSGQPLAKSEVAGALTLVGGVTVLSLARTVPSASVSVGTAANWPAAAGQAARLLALPE
jgi:hypothetical protein